MNGTVIAWHTPDKKYTGLATRLARDLDYWSAPHRFYVIEKIDGEGWIDVITRTKTTLWERAIADVGGPLLFLDVDCHVNAPLTGLWKEMQGADIGLAIHYKPARRRAKQRISVSARALYVANTDRARDFMRQWARISTAPGTNEESTMLELIGRHDVAARIARIPNRYAGIEAYKAPPNAVITHCSTHAEDLPLGKKIEVQARRLYRSVWPKRQEAAPAE